jgi:glycerol-3-phosphate dehydrogenase
MLSREETLSRIPNIEPEHLLGGVEYFDGQFDDPVSQSHWLNQPWIMVHAFNYIPVTAVTKTGNMVTALNAGMRTAEGATSSRRGSS